MIVKIFLLGRPGSGKTTAFQYFEMSLGYKGWHTTRFREYRFLQEMFQKQEEMKASNVTRMFLPVENGGFDIVDFSVLNESANLLEKQIQCHISTEQRNEFIFIELARDDYSQELKCFSSDFLRDSYFLFVEAPIETCIQRIQWRVDHPMTTDGHFVSERILRSYYAKDNRQYMASNFKTDYDIYKETEVIDNVGSIEDFCRELEAFANVILTREAKDEANLHFHKLNEYIVLTPSYN